MRYVTFAIVLGLCQEVFRANGGTRPIIQCLEFLDAAGRIVSENGSHSCVPQDPLAWRERPIDHRHPCSPLGRQSAGHPPRSPLSRCRSTSGQRNERPTDLQSRQSTIDITFMAELNPKLYMVTGMLWDLSRATANGHLSTVVDSALIGHAMEPRAPCGLF